jgi:hypothetical protein
MNDILLKWIFREVVVAYSRLHLGIGLKGVTVTTGDPLWGKLVSWPRCEPTPACTVIQFGLCNLEFYGCLNSHQLLHELSIGSKLKAVWMFGRYKWHVSSLETSVLARASAMWSTKRVTISRANSLKKGAQMYPVVSFNVFESLWKLSSWMLSCLANGGHCGGAW